jgi:enterochelin esterase-like enzyme
LLAYDRKVDVYVPPGYETDTTRRYPVMYLNGWFGLFVYAAEDGKLSTRNESPESLTLKNIIEPMILVAVNSPATGGQHEYRPAEVNEKESQGYLYAKMLVEEIKPFIDTTYRTLPDQENTGITGISIGAESALYTAISFPNTFGKLALISPHIVYGKYLTVRMLLQLPDKLPWRVWMDGGTMEPLYVRDTALLTDALITIGWDPAQIKRLVVRGGQHNGKTWQKIIGPIYRFLYDKEQPKFEPTAKPETAPAK